MRYVIALLGFLLVAAETAPAQYVHIPGNDPTRGGGNAWPWNTSGRPEWRYQLLFTAAQMGGQPGVIKEIAFAPMSTGMHAATKFEMILSHTTASALSGTWATNLPNPVSVIPEGPHSWNATKDVWSPIPFLQPFTYDGSSNLVVDIKYLGGMTSGGFAGTCRSDSGWGTTILRSWDNTTGAYTRASTSSANRNLGLITRFTVDTTTLTGSGTTRPGGRVDLDLQSVLDPAGVYQVGTSLGTGPIVLGPRRLNLSPDDLLVATVGGFLPQLFVNYVGVLDNQGKARAAINLPGDSRLIGVALHTAFVTLDPNAPLGIGNISNTFSFSITS